MSKNNITGDRLISRPNTESFEKNFDKIFGEKKSYKTFDTKMTQRTSTILCERCGMALAARLDESDATCQTIIVSPCYCLTSDDE